jgi:hypothetical protein
VDFEKPAQTSAELGEKGHKVSHETVRRLLLEMGYSLQADFKSIEKRQHADRDEQFKSAQDAKAKITAHDKTTLGGTFLGDG